MPSGKCAALLGLLCFCPTGICPAAPARRGEGISYGAFTVKTPDFLDCSGPGFDAEWDDFHATAVEWDQRLNRLVEGGWGPAHLSSEDQDVGERVSLMSHALLEKWFSNVKQTNGSGLDSVIHGHVPAETLNGTCYYGLLTCLWIRAQALMFQAATGEAMLELSAAMQLLGSDFRADYVDSTRWPVRGLDVQQSLLHGRLTKVPSLSRVINVRENVVPHGGVPLDIDFFAPSKSQGATGFRELQVAVFGNHAALSSEPATMLRGALQEWRIIVHWHLSECRWNDPVHHYQCRLHCMLIGECSFQDSGSVLSRRLLKMASIASDVAGTDPEAAEGVSIAAMLDLTAQLWQSGGLRMCSMAICTIPLICSLLRAVTPLPLLGYFAMTTLLRPIPGLAEWAMIHMAEMARNTRQTAFAVQNPILSELGAHQLGVVLPVVRPFGLYSYQHHVHSMFPNPFAQLLPHTGSHNYTVLVTRSWLVMETSFLHMMSAFVEHVEPEFPLKFLVLRSSSGKGGGDINLADATLKGERLKDLVNSDTNVFLDSKNMMLFRAGIMLPQLPSQMSIYELHSLHLPVFIPGRDWLFRLYQQRSWDLTASGNYMLKGTPRTMNPPLFNNDIFSSGDTLAHWLLLYDRRFETRLPGILPFESFPDLLGRLLVSDFDSIRESMRKHNEQVFPYVLAWYRNVAFHLLSR